MSRKYDVLIIGAGTGGLVLALLMAKKGLKVAILDQQLSPMPLPRGEILQPNGLKILNQLGLLQDLLKADVHYNKKVHFQQASGNHLCTINYSTLPSPYNYALVLLPEVLQGLLLREVAELPNIETYWGTAFKYVCREGIRVTGAKAQRAAEPIHFECKMVVGGDGAGSRVRDAFQIKHQSHAYADGYITMVVDRPPGFESDSSYILGKEMIFGAFPVSSQKVYLFYLVPKNKLEVVRDKGIKWLKAKILSLHSERGLQWAAPLKEIASWDQTAYMRCFRVRCDRWVVNGGALLGDAAHAMNPHVAQGRNTAMEDAMILSHVLESCFQSGDFSDKALSDYEMKRRVNVEKLQALGDEMVLFWNSALPPIVWLRDRVFKKVGKRTILHDKLLRTVAGIQMSPFNLLDRLSAVSP